MNADGKFVWILPQFFKVEENKYHTTTKKVQKQSTEWEKLFANHIW